MGILGHKNLYIMDAKQVDLFLTAQGKNFPAEQLGSIRERLLNADDSKLPMIQATEFKSPMVGFLLAFFLGGFGAEYFYVGKTGMAIVKWITCCGLGIWGLINLFRAGGMVREWNMNKLNTLL